MAGPSSSEEVNPVQLVSLAAVEEGRGVLRFGERFGFLVHILLKDTTATTQRPTTNLSSGNRDSSVRHSAKT
jgi:hypothetical protein